MFETKDNTFDLNRRQWLHGDFLCRHPPIRPPWATPAETFAQLCSRCNRCIEVCEDELLVKGSGGLPEIRFEATGCDFCGACIKACETGALAAPAPAPSLAWLHRASINNDCLSLNGIVCRSCGDACDTQAIRFELQTGGRALPRLDIELCNGCGACFAVCPNDSISLQIPEAS